MSTTILISNTVIPSLSALVLRHGVNPEQLFKEAGINLADLHMHQKDLELEQLEALFDVIILKLNMPHLGLVLGEQLQADMLGIFGPLVASSPNISTAFDCFSRFKHVFHPLFDLSVETHQNEIHIVYGSQDDTPIGSRPSYAELLFTSLLNLGGLFVGDKLQAERLEFRHSQPDYLEEYQRIFNCPVRFDCERDMMVSSADLFERPMLSQSFSLHQMLKQQANIALSEKQPTYSSQVRQFVKQHISNTELNAEMVAHHLNLSPRTLQRRLSEESTHFKQIKDEVIKQQAQHLLTRTQLSTEVIALELGYSDRSNFVNAFKRLTGQSPSQFREQQKAD